MVLPSPQLGNSERLSTGDAVQAAEYQKTLNLPDDLKTTLIPVLQKNYGTQISAFTSEQHDQFATILEMLYAVDAIQDIDAEATKKPQNIGLIDQIIASQSETGQHVPLADLWNLGEQLIDLEQQQNDYTNRVIAYLHDYDTSFYHDIHIQTMKRLSGDAKHIYQQQYGLPSPQEMEESNVQFLDKYSDIHEELQSVKTQPGQDADQTRDMPEGTSASLDDPSQDGLTYPQITPLDQLDTPTANESINIIEANLSVFDDQIDLRQRLGGIDRFMASLPEMITPHLQAQLPKLKLKLSDEESQEYIATLLQTPGLETAGYTLGHGFTDGLVGLLHDRLKPNLNPTDGLTYRTNILIAIKNLGVEDPTTLFEPENKKKLDQMIQLLGIDGAISHVQTNTTALITRLFESQATKQGFRDTKKRLKAQGADHGVKDSKLVLGQTIFSNTLESLDHYPLVQEFMVQAMQGVLTPAQIDAYATRLLDAKDQTTLGDGEQQRPVTLQPSDSEALLGDLADLTEIVPDGIQNQEAYATKTKDLLTQRAFNEPNDLINTLGSFFGREFAADNPKIREFIKGFVEFFGIDISVDDVHDRLDAGKTTKTYATLENQKKYRLDQEKIFVESNTTEYEYSDDEGVLTVLPVGSSTQTATTKYRSEDNDNLRGFANDDGTLTYHRQLADGTTTPVDDSESPAVYSSITEMILHDFNPKAFIDSACQTRKKTVKQLKVPGLQDGEIANYENTTTALGPFVEAILEEHSNLNSQSDLVGLLMHRVQKAGRFDGITVVEEPVVEEPVVEEPVVEEPVVEEPVVEEPVVEEPVVEEPVVEEPTPTE